MVEHSLLESWFEFTKQNGLIFFFKTGSRSIVAGWGATNPESVHRPKVLQAVDVYTLNNTLCEQWHVQAGIRSVPGSQTIKIMTVN